MSTGRTSPSTGVDDLTLLSHPDRPELKLPAIPAQFDGNLPEMTRLGPELGEHSEEILRELGLAV
jgi:crotonobetainyl-CoA:carnitine CoA-transferase CaiB-like acyl-CoA transferase